MKWAAKLLLAAERKLEALELCMVFPPVGSIALSVRLAGDCISVMGGRTWRVGGRLDGRGEHECQISGLTTGAGGGACQQRGAGQCGFFCTHIVALFVGPADYAPKQEALGQGPCEGCKSSGHNLDDKNSKKGNANLLYMSSEEEAYLDRWEQMSNLFPPSILN